MKKKIITAMRIIYSKINKDIFYFKEFGLKNLLRAKGRHVAFPCLIEVKRTDCKYPFWLREPSTDVSMYSQIFINFEYDFAIEKEPEVIIDAGANIGLASIYFANKYRQAKIIAIEPEKNNFELLLKNTAQYTNIIPIQAALWNLDGKIDILDSGLGECGYMASDKSINTVLKTPSVRYVQQVTSVTIKKIVKEYQLDRIDILKMDIEGSEKEVFSNSVEWIDKVKSIIIELHEYMKSGCNRIFYNYTNDFDNEWQQGENVFLSKGHYLKKISR
ncbi:methyltransferase FkbM family [Treponema primitia ZAS-2]|uniref:Methyltransferase FkbM family n=1 Tax=Treponema primitia (strain ATCC BAA-887 / DSM 12427 / ZAS-2) TaxID=545694 RepID=F5YMC1_TREPZ|nr:FkbM family methyltransferase [Treponema primitia]AEF85245.1 methyltransferase FkbM family [Treponema primitia ZAS-2]